MLIKQYALNGVDALLNVNPADVVPTQQWIADDIVQHFQPKGICLDPCRGDGVFYQRLPAGSLWCEIREGRDFFDFNDRVDWCMSNPP